MPLAQALTHACVFSPAPVDKEMCQVSGRVIQRNRTGCCSVKCASPWRYCLPCLEQGALTQGINTKTGYCEFHTKNGPTAQLPKGPIFTGTKGPRPAGSVESAEAKPTRGVQLAAAIFPTQGTQPVKSTVGTPVAPPPVRKIAEVEQVAQTAKPPVVGKETTKVVQPIVVERKRATRKVPSDVLERIKKARAEGVETTVSVKRVRPLKGQYRTTFDPDNLASLAESLKKTGQLTAAFIRPILMDQDGRDREIIDGENRWRALQLAGIDGYKVIEVNILDEDLPYAPKILSGMSNFHRKGHTLLEEMELVREFFDDFGFEMSEIAMMIGKSEDWVDKLHDLQNLVVPVKEMLNDNLPREKKLPVAHAIEISKLRSGHEHHQLALAHMVIRERPSISKLRKAVVAVAEEAGIDIRQRKVDPSDRLKTIVRKVKLAKKIVDDVKERMSEKDVIELLPLSQLYDDLDDALLELSRAVTKGCIGVMDEARPTRRGMSDADRRRQALGRNSVPPPPPPRKEVVPPPEPQKLLAPPPVPQPPPAVVAPKAPPQAQASTTVVLPPSRATVNGDHQVGVDRSLAMIDIKYVKKLATGFSEPVEGRVDVLAYADLHRKRLLDWQVAKLPEPKNHAEFRTRMGIKL